MTPRAISACMMACAPSACARLTWLPRCAGSRGVTIVRPCPAQRRVDQRDEEVGQGDRLGADRRQAAGGLGREQRVDAALERRQRQDRRRAAQEPRDAGRGPIGGRERERSGVAEPAGQRLAPALGVHAAQCAADAPR